MKALEYLKRLRESWGVLISEDGLKNLDEAITELEALQAPKNCDGCKYNRFGSGSDGIAVDCTLVGYGCIRGLWKDYYEPKDSK
jgi:hypothetical protein